MSQVSLREVLLELPTEIWWVIFDTMSIEYRSKASHVVAELEEFYAILRRDFRSISHFSPTSMWRVSVGEASAPCNHMSGRNCLTCAKLRFAFLVANSGRAISLRCKMYSLQISSVRDRCHQCARG